MFGLTVRWSLLGCAEGTDAALRAYVKETSVARFTGRPGLHLKTWQMVDGGFFAGVYVWASAAARSEFLAEFRAHPSPVTQLVGHEPDVIEEWDLAGFAVGAEGTLS